MRASGASQFLTGLRLRCVNRLAGREKDGHVHAEPWGADWTEVDTGQSFLHTLNEMLSHTAAASSTQADVSARVATPAFWGEAVPVGRLSPRQWRHPGQASITRDGVATTAPRADQAPRAARPAPPPVRRLTTTQQHALRRLQRLGAIDLGPGFSDHQLRTAFRALAKRFHPDRHPASGPVEREDLAWTFASVCDAYRELTGAASQA